MCWWSKYDMHGRWIVHIGLFNIVVSPICLCSIILCKAEECIVLSVCQVCEVPDIVPYSEQSLWLQKVVIQGWKCAWVLVVTVILMVWLTGRAMNSKGSHLRHHFGYIITKNVSCCFTSCEILSFPVIFNLINGILIFISAMISILCMIRAWKYSVLS
jgi:hypothetical protein